VESLVDVEEVENEVEVDWLVLEVDFEVELLKDVEEVLTEIDVLWEVLLVEMLVD
jgi:hypothetical protein